MVTIMKIHSIMLLLWLLCLAPASFATELTLGEPLTLTSVTKISEINAHPETYIGKRVLIEGLVIDVCSHRGCWVDLASDLPFDRIKVKVVDGEIIFPLEAKGKNAQVEGIVEELRLTQEQALSMARHRAEMQGMEFDPSSISGPQTYYRIRGLGAVIAQQ